MAILALGTSMVPRKAGLIAGGDPAIMKVLIFGSGSLAKVACHTLSAACAAQLEICLAARSLAKVNDIVLASRVRAKLSNSQATFQGYETHWEEAELEHLLGTVRPDLVLHVASEVSPWDLKAGSRWAELICRGGFGVTLPLQTGLVTRVAKAMARTMPDCPLMNASYPDAVNPVLKAQGLNLLCGVGNVAILEAFYREQNTLPGTVSMLAHHSDLNRICRSETPTAARVRAWAGDTEVAVSPEAFRPAQRVRGSEQNQVTGATIAKLLENLAGGKSFRCHVPAPNGLPGGYPVRFSGMKVALDLPAGLTAEEAIAYNRASAEYDGVVVEDGMVRFTGSASKAIAEMVPGCPTEFAAAEIGQIADMLKTLRA